MVPQRASHLREIIEEVAADQGPHLGTFPIYDFVDEFIELYGYVSIADIPMDEYHDLIDKHDEF